jgi:hypothetical protein
MSARLTQLHLFDGRLVINLRATENWTGTGRKKEKGKTRRSRVVKYIYYDQSGIAQPYYLREMSDFILRTSLL